MARGSQGRSGRLLTVLGAALAAMVALAPSPGRGEIPRRFALLIGVNKSSASDVPKLNYAVKDAEAVGELFAKNGFEQPVILTDSEANRDNIVRELVLFAHEVGPTDTFVLYFAGHGVTYQFPSGTEHTYWLGRHANLANLDVEGIRLSQVIEYLADVPAQRKLLILDHCYSGNVVEKLASGGGGRDLDEDTLGLESRERRLTRVESIYKQSLGSVPNLVVIGSASDRAYEFDDLGHGLMTYALIQALTSPPAELAEGGIGARELVAYLKHKVEALSAARGVPQVPLAWTVGDPDDWPLIEFVGVASLKAFLTSMLIQGLQPADELWGYQMIDQWKARTDTGLEPDATAAVVVHVIRTHMALRDKGTFVPDTFVESFTNLHQSAVGSQ